jgi:hypothetical protein
MSACPARLPLTPRVSDRLPRRVTIGKRLNVKFSSGGDLLVTLSGLHE